MRHHNSLIVSSCLGICYGEWFSSAIIYDIFIFPILILVESKMATSLLNIYLKRQNFGIPFFMSSSEVSFYKTVNNIQINTINKYKYNKNRLCWNYKINYIHKLFIFFIYEYLYNCFECWNGYFSAQPWVNKMTNVICTFKIVNILAKSGLIVI